MVGTHWKLTFTDLSAAPLSVRLIRLLVLDELRLDFFFFQRGMLPVEYRWTNANRR